MPKIRYKKILPGTAYRLIGHGPVVLVSTRSKKGDDDISAVAWHCPIGKSPTQILLAIGKGHQTFLNIRDTSEFIVSVPRPAQIGWVKQAGSVSGRNVDKFKTFKIQSFRGKKVRARIPAGCLGYIECKVIRCYSTEEVRLVIGECVYAAVDPQGFKGRVLAEKAAGKTLHHLGDAIFAVPADRVKRPVV